MRTLEGAADKMSNRSASRERRPPESSWRAVDATMPLDRPTILYLQQTAGNSSVAQLMLQRKTGLKTAAKPKKAPAKQSKLAKKKATPAPAKKPAYDETEPTIETPAGPVGGWTGATGINAGEREIVGTRRIPLEGIKSGYQEPDEAHQKAGVKDASRADTTEAVAQEAIALVPSDVGNDDKSVEVLLHLHGYGIGYREQGPRPKGHPAGARVRGKSATSRST